MDVYYQADYTELSEQFGNLVLDWARLDGYVTDAIIRHAQGIWRDFNNFWKDARSTQNGRRRPIEAFVANYIEVVENVPLCVSEGKSPSPMQMWTCWGTTLRLLEVN